MSAFPAESGAEMRQSLLSLGTVNKMLCRYQNCWTVARVACGQTVINMDIHFHYGYLFHLGKRHSKLMKVLLGWKYSFFFRGEQLTESLKQYEYYWDKVMALLSSIGRYTVECSVLCGALKFYSAGLTWSHTKNILMSMKWIPGASAHLHFCVNGE